MRRGNARQSTRHTFWLHADRRTQAPPRPERESVGARAHTQTHWLGVKVQQVVIAQNYHNDEQFVLGIPQRCLSDTPPALIAAGCQPINSYRAIEGFDDAPFGNNTICLFSSTGQHSPTVSMGAHKHNGVSVLARQPWRGIKYKLNNAPLPLAGPQEIISG